MSTIRIEKYCYGQEEMVYKLIKRCTMNMFRLITVMKEMHFFMIDTAF